MVDFTQKLHTTFGNTQGRKIQVAANFCGISLETPQNKPQFYKSKQFTKLSPLGTLPVLETPEGTLTDPTSILVFFAESSNSPLYTGDAETLAKIDQWLELVSVNLDPALNTWLAPIYGQQDNDQKVVKHAMTDARKVLTEADRALKQKPYLCGNDLTLADITLACSLVYPMRAVMNENFLKPLAKLKQWFLNVSSLPEFTSVWGASRLCNEQVPVTQVKKQQKKAPQKKAPQKKAPAKKEEVKKVEEKKEPFSELPPSQFDLIDWKITFVNSQQQREDMQQFWQKLDKEGWSLHYMHYDKDEGEGVILYQFQNLLEGFLHKLDFFRRFSFGSLGIYGEEPSLEIKGVLLWRGQGVPQLLFDHPSFEFYKTRQLDPDSEEDRRLVEEYWCTLSGEVEGSRARDVKIWR